MGYVTYRDLVQRFGDRNADDLMLTIERLAQLQADIITPMDKGERLQRALEALNGNDKQAAGRVS